MLHANQLSSPSLLSYHKNKDLLVLNWYNVEGNGDVSEFLSESFECGDEKPNIITFMRDNELHFIHYESSTGKANIYRFNSIEQRSEKIVHLLLKKNSILLPIEKNEEVFLFIYTEEGIVEVFDISKTLNSNIFDESQADGAFMIGVDKWSQGWKFNLFFVKGFTYCICYKPESGRGSFDCFETKSGFSYNHIADYAWEPGLTVTTFVIEGIPHILFYDKKQGNSKFMQLDITTGELYLSFEGQWTTDWKFTPMLIEGRIWFLSYKKKTGAASLDVLTIHNGLSYHNVWRKEFPKNRSFKGCVWWNLFQYLHRSNLLKVLTLNVFHDVTSNPKITAGRLQKQIDEVKRLKPDVICLQEAYHPIVTKMYGQSFPTYSVTESDRRIGFGYFVAKLVRGMTSAFFMIIFYTLLYTLLDFSADTVPSITTLFAGCYMLTHYLLTFTQLHYLEKFLSDTSLGLVILTNQALLISEPEYCARKFKSQDGDFLNTLKPRGYLYREFYLGNSSNKDKVAILNTHLNTGVINPKRIYQVTEIVDFINDKEIPILLCGDTNSHSNQPEMEWLFDGKDRFIDCWDKITKLPGIDEAGFTWNNNNPLTSGLLREPDQRVDYVAYKLPAKFPLTISIAPIDCTIVFDKEPFISDHFGVLATFVCFSQ